LGLEEPGELAGDVADQTASDFAVGRGINHLGVLPIEVVDRR
jgi:hypothetical protein